MPTFASSPAAFPLLFLHIILIALFHQSAHCATISTRPNGVARQPEQQTTQLSLLRSIPPRATTAATTLSSFTAESSVSDQPVPIQHHQRHRHRRRVKGSRKVWKRLTLYPAMGLEEDQHQQKQTSKSPATGRKHSGRYGKLGRSRNGLRGRVSPSSSASSFGESIQMCLFLRIGCEKIRRSYNSQRLADFVRGMQVQERMEEGYVIHRKPSEH